MNAAFIADHSAPITSTVAAATPGNAAEQDPTPAERASRA